MLAALTHLKIPAANLDRNEHPDPGRELISLWEYWGHIWGVWPCPSGVRQLWGESEPFWVPFPWQREHPWDWDQCRCHWGCDSSALGTCCSPPPPFGILPWQFPALLSRLCSQGTWGQQGPGREQREPSGSWQGAEGALGGPSAVQTPPASPSLQPIPPFTC